MNETPPDGIQARDPATPVRFVTLDSEGRVTTEGRTALVTLLARQQAGEAALEVPASSPVSAPHWVYEGGEFVYRPRLPPLGDLKAQLAGEIDRAAEEARTRFITAGAGQALEYQATEREAYDALAHPTPDEANYPFLRAEMDATEAATGIRPTLLETAGNVVALSQAWTAAGSEIKRLRRSAKMAVEAAETHDEARAAAIVVWPRPGD